MGNARTVTDLRREAMEVWVACIRQIAQGPRFLSSYCSGSIGQHEPGQPPGRSKVLLERIPPHVLQLSKDSHSQTILSEITCVLYSMWTGTTYIEE